METGRTVILLNLENLYESLYDVLNQYYMDYSGVRYVDLGLQTHRVKCRVHDNFKWVISICDSSIYTAFACYLLTCTTSIGKSCDYGLGWNEAYTVCTVSGACTIWHVPYGGKFPEGKIFMVFVVKFLSANILTTNKATLTPLPTMRKQQPQNKIQELLHHKYFALLKLPVIR